MLNYYNKSFGQALLHLFPEIGLVQFMIPKRLSCGGSSGGGDKK